MTSNQGGRYLSKERIEITQVHGDLSQEVVRITVDKLKLTLHLHIAKVEQRREWVAPAGILATLLATFTTTTFKDWLLSAATWRALFIMSTLIVVGWLIRSIWRAVQSSSIDDLVESIKQSR